MIAARNVVVGRMKLYLGTVLIDEQYYQSKDRRNKVLRLWDTLTKDRMKNFYIQYLPRVSCHSGGKIKQMPLHVPRIDTVNLEFETFLSDELNYQNMKQITKQQEEIIRENLNKMTPKQVAEKANVSVAAIYSRRRARGGWLDENKEEEVPVVSNVQKIVRPPAVYTNRRLYAH